MLENVTSNEKTLSSVPSLVEMAKKDRDIIELIKIIQAHGLRREAVQAINRAMEKASRIRPVTKH